MHQKEIVVRMAAEEDHEAVTSLLFRLLTELNYAGQYGYSHETLAPAVAKLVRDGTGYWVFLADLGQSRSLGVITLNECSAVYAFGNFGEIAELYVAPEYRSDGIGAKLVDQAIGFALQRGWSHLEVGAPAVPAWQRTVDFYQRCGFSVVGPRLTLDLPTLNSGIQPPARSGP